jgi:hypothetical protein
MIYYDCFSSELQSLLISFIFIVAAKCPTTKTRTNEQEPPAPRSAMIALDHLLETLTKIPIK